MTMSFDLLGNIAPYAQSARDAIAVSPMKNECCEVWALICGDVVRLQILSMCPYRWG